MFGSLAFKTPLSIEITIFLEVAASDNLTWMTYSFIFCNKSSLTGLGLPRLFKISDSKSSFWLLNLRFQLLIYVRKKEYFGYFDLKQLIPACVPLLCACFLIYSLTREGMLILYEEPFLRFVLLKLSSSAFTADASTTITYPVALTNPEIHVRSFLVFLAFKIWTLISYCNDPSST